MRQVKQMRKDKQKQFEPPTGAELFGYALFVVLMLWSWWP
jgi:hypothetical protein